MVVAIEELDPVASPGGWTQTVTVNKYEETPHGSRHLRETGQYNYKATPPHESQEHKDKRLDVKRNARSRLLDKLQRPEKHEAKKAKRRKSSQAVAAGATESLLPAALPALCAVQGVRATPATDWASALDPEGQDLATRRDWALLRAWKQQPTPDAVLRVLRELGLDGEEEPWTASRVQERHEFLCRCVRVATRLVGEAGGLRQMRSLAYLCA